MLFFVLRYYSLRNELSIFIWVFDCVFPSKKFQFWSCRKLVLSSRRGMVLKLFLKMWKPWKLIWKCLLTYFYLLNTSFRKECDMLKELIGVSLNPFWTLDKFVRLVVICCLSSLQFVNENLIFWIWNWMMLEYVAFGLHIMSI